MTSPDNTNGANGNGRHPGSAISPELFNSRFNQQRKPLASADRAQLDLLAGMHLIHAERFDAETLRTAFMGLYDNVDPDGRLANRDNPRFRTMADCIETASEQLDHLRGINSHQGQVIALDSHAPNVATHERSHAVIAQAIDALDAAMKRDFPEDYAKAKHERNGVNGESSPNGRWAR